jgi:hypothetical protein
MCTGTSVVQRIKGEMVRDDNMNAQGFLTNTDKLTKLC